MKHNESGRSNQKKQTKKSTPKHVVHLDKVGNPIRMKAAPVAMGFEAQAELKITNGRERGSVRVQGRDWLGRAVAAATDAPGTCWRNDFMNPLALSGTRLSLFAQMYDKFRFNRQRFTYVPSGGTTPRGAIGMSYDPDISDLTPLVGDSGVRSYLAMLDAKSGAAGFPMSLDCPLSHPEEGLFCNPVPGGDERLSYQGQFYLWCLEPTSLTAGQAIGDVFVEYDIEFWCPQLDTQVPLLQATSDAVSGLGTDALRAFAVGFGADTNTGPPSFQPKMGSDGRAFIDLVQGVYRLYNSIQQSSAGAAVLDIPVLVANDPKPAPAPQPEVLINTGAASNAAGNVAFADYFLAVPPGGAKLTQNYDDITGLGLATNVAFNLEKISPSWFDLNNAFLP